MFFAPATGGLRGALTPPPDKSLSHRAALLAAMCSDPVRIVNYLDAQDTNSTLAAVQALGALAERRPEGLVIRGTGLRAAAQPDATIDVGNAGTLMRLLPGWLAGQPGDGHWTLDGDASIRRRPVDRIAEPLRLMGAQIEAREDRFAPFTVTGAPLRGHRVRAAGGLRAGQVVHPARGPAGHRLDHGRRARRRAATTPSACSRAPGRSSSATPTASPCIPRTSSSSTRSSSRATPPRPPSSSPPRCWSRGRGLCSRASGSTGRGSASCASPSAWAP